jgi:iron complex transport system substrate-binding protein
MIPVAIAPRTLDPVEDITRRRLLEALLAAPIVIACGDGDDEETSNTPTRVVDTSRGPVTIPVRPQRVVSLDYFSPQDLYDVGFKPIGVPASDMTELLPEYHADYQAATTIGDYGEVKLEVIAGLKPDLILGNSTEAVVDVYDRLSAIAPTVLFDVEVSGEWVNLAKQYADVVGRSDAVAQLESQYLARAEEIKTTYADALGRLRWAAASDSSAGLWMLYLPDSNPGVVLTQIGARLVDAAARESGGVMYDLPYERFDLLADADIIGLPGTTDGQFDPAATQLRDQPAFKLLNASQTQHVYPLSRFLCNSYKGALGLLDEVEAILKQFESA